MSEAKFTQLEAKLDKALKRIQNLEDTKAIEQVQYKYGYYLDKCLYEQAVGLFANSPDAEVHFHGGVWKGKKGIADLYIKRFRASFTNGKNGPVYGFLLDHPMCQMITDVDEDGIHAQARLRVNMHAGLHESAVIDDKEHRDSTPRQWMEGALYENDYIKEDGVWKIQTLRYRPQWHCNWTEGIAFTQPEFVPFIKDLKSEQNPYGPDEIEKVTLWPDMDVLPFHYPDADGNWLKPEEIAAPRKTYSEGQTGRIS